TSSSIAARIPNALVQYAAADYGGSNNFIAGALHLSLSECPGANTDMNLTAHVSSTANGTTGTGQMTQNTAFGGCQGHLSADVNCLDVVGSTAIVTGQVTDGNGIYAKYIGRYLDWTFTDNPSPTPDGFSGDLGTGAK